MPEVYKSTPEIGPKLPTHPWLENGRYNDDDLPDGRGKYHFYGPNYTADPIVITTEERPRVLLITRGDGGGLALPGGFVDGDEDPRAASDRELFEETGLALDEAVSSRLIYQGVVADRRATKHAWPETSAYLYEIPTPLDVKAGDDAKEAKWYYIDELTGKLYGSHKELIDMALRENQPSIRDILNLPESEIETTVVSAGHMAYDHLVIRHGEDELFIKAHDPSKFTDPVREAHSRAYLAKEFSVYQHLAANDFEAIPNRVDLVDDRILAMDALRPHDGWVWRAPNIDTGGQFDDYVTAVLAGFDQLGQIPAPHSDSYRHDIEDTYSTLWHEGWDAIDTAKAEQVVAKIRDFSKGWSLEQQSAAERLIADLEELRQASLAIDRNPEMVLSHGDARQSNIAWHPNLGAKIVDWSWFDQGPKDADSTMFLIDLAKAGHDVSKYMRRFSRDQAIVLIGFWLNHSLWSTHDGSTTVREHQVASAIAAYTLIQK